MTEANEMRKEARTLSEWYRRFAELAKEDDVEKCSRMEEAESVAERQPNR